MIKYVVKPGKSKTEMGMPGKVLYNRAMFNAVIIAEAITVAQKMTGKKMVTGADVRLGLENVKLDAARLKELGLEGFTAPLIGGCADHENGGSIFVQQWDGSDWIRQTDLIPPMTDVVQPLLTAAAEKYVSDKSGWTTQKCN